MKKLNFYDKLNAATLLMFSPEWRKVKRARKKAESFETPDVTIPTEIRTIAGRKIRLAEAGPTDAPLVVLLSPFPESILSYTGCWEALTEKCRVIAIDLPGFGASEGDRKDMSPSAQGAHLATIFDELELQEIHLIAPDVGMAAALDYVLNHNHRLVSLAVGHGIGAPGPFKIAFMTNMLAKLGFMRFTTGLLGAGPLIAFTSKIGAIRNKANPKQMDDYKRSYSGRAREVVHWFKNFRSRAKELSDRVNQIELPTLIFWGELDVLFDPSNAEHLHAAMPQSKLEILPEAGHTSWADQPEMFADMVIDWVLTENTSN
jgi:pimeloyl-ACP methyl ester carboxylesterase